MKSIDLTKTVPLNLLLYSDGRLETLHGDFSFTLVTEADSSSEDDLKKARIAQNSSFTKVLTFLESVLHETIIYGAGSGDELSEILGSLENNFMVLPEVSEMTVIAALHCKLNHIINENSVITTISCNEKIQNLTFSYTLINDDDYDGYTELPLQENWCTELSYWDTPWWCRNDIITLDRIAENQEELDTWLTNSKTAVEESSAELFAQIDKQYEDLFLDPDSDKKGELIEVDFSNERWKPELLD